MDINFGKIDKIKTYSVSKSSTVTPNISTLYKEIDYANFSDYVEDYTEDYTRQEEICFFGDEIVCPSPEYMSMYIKRCQNVYFNTDKFDSYKIFRACLVTDKFISKPLRDTSYATQGCCEINGVACITSYDTGFNSVSLFGANKPKRSVLSLADSEGRQKNLYFDNFAHVGGIAYHSGSNKVYVPGTYSEPDSNGNFIEKNYINVYDISNFASAKNNDVLVPETKISLAENNYGVTTASYLTVNGNNLFAGVFKNDGYGTINKYDIDNDGNLSYVTSITPPVKNVQGMCIYEYKNTELYIFSSSYGRTNDSTLYVGILNEDGSFTKVLSIAMPCLSEQVSVDADRNLMIVFESDCIKYGDGADSLGFSRATRQVGNVCYLDIEKILNLFIP